MVSLSNHVAILLLKETPSPSFEIATPASNAGSQ